MERLRHHIRLDQDKSSCNKPTANKDDDNYQTQNAESKGRAEYKQVKLESNSKADNQSGYRHSSVHGNVSSCAFLLIYWTFVVSSTPGALLQLGFSAVFVMKPLACIIRYIRHVEVRALNAMGQFSQVGVPVGEVFQRNWHLSVQCFWFYVLQIGA